MARKPKQINIAVIDFETDPFLFGRMPRPFAAGFYRKGEYAEFWGDSCPEQLLQYINAIDEELIIYAHNGGKFDFYFLLEWLGNPIKIINGRIVSAKIGKHTLRDSYAILPMPLAGYAKNTIDYAYFEEETRNGFKREILDYLHSDCKYLFDLCTAFVHRFGPRLTIGGTAMRELKKFHPIEELGENHDKLFRQFYFGGRVQCFEGGVLNGNFNVYDVNSMYPSVMRNCDHPSGSDYRYICSNLRMDSISEASFIRCIADCADFPFRTKEGLDYGHGKREYFITGHEYRMAVMCGSLRAFKLIEAYEPVNTQRFENFVDAFVADKILAEEKGDKIGRTFAKLILNSAYGKFAQNPTNFSDWHIRYRGEPPPEPLYAETECEEGWRIYADYGEIDIWTKPSPSLAYSDVATGASITGAARAVLMHAIHLSERPIYCDTDSIICESANIELDDKRLGAWKTEARGDLCAVAGKKLYALFQDGKAVKWASKGCKLDPEKIIDIAKGGIYNYQRDAPNFKLSGDHKFIKRDIRSTLNGKSTSSSN